MILAAVCSFGMETALSGEIKRAGLKKTFSDDGFICFEGEERDLAASLMMFRTADRLFVSAGDFDARDFDGLYEGLRYIEWERYIRMDDKIVVNASIKKSPFKSERYCQATAKKALTDRLGAYYGLSRMPETGERADILLRIRGERVSVLVDAGGGGLHNRGYSLKRGLAPMRETLAAGMVLLSRWRGKETIIDPFCGSGTIAIEAAMIAADIAPGCKRKNAAENWPSSDPALWSSVREEMEGRGRKPGVDIVARDINPVIIEAAKENARRAGVDGMIRFEAGDAADIVLGPGPGLIIANPPFGIRLQDEQEAAAIYEAFGEVYMKAERWDLSLITSYEGFEHVFGARASRNRKLYNGRIKSYLYFYYGADNG